MADYGAATGYGLPPAELSPQRRRLFERAVRHSRRVRRLRVLLPAASLAIALAVAGYAAVLSSGLGLVLDMATLTRDGLTMDAPRLSGHDGSGRHFEVTAARAVQDLTGSRLVRLHEITARVTQPDGEWAEFTAESGRYDASAETVVLDGEIRVVSSEGYSADLTTASIDLNDGTVESDAPVAFDSALGAVEASGMSVDRRGETVRFRDGVRLTINPNAGSERADEDNGGEEAR